MDQLLDVDIIPETTAVEEVLGVDKITCEKVFRGSLSFAPCARRRGRWRGREISCCGDLSIGRVRRLSTRWIIRTQCRSSAADLSVTIISSGRNRGKSGCGCRGC